MEAATLYLVGTGIQAGAKVGAGMHALDASRFNAAALERQAAGERAAGQRTAFERRREADLVISRQIALGAASGAPTGPSLLDIIGDTAARGEYQAQGEMYTAEARARNLQDRANIARWEGRNAFTGSILEAVGSIGIGAGRYGMNFGPSTTNRVPPFRPPVIAYG
jgi:hypothetical protein